MAVLNGLGNYLQLRAINRIGILVIFAAYLFMAWALANHRIFNARHVLATVGHRMAVVGILAASAWGMSLPLGQFMSNPAAWVVSTFFCGLAVFWLDQKTRFWLGLDDELLLAAFRSEIIHASRREAGSLQLSTEFERLLSTHHQASLAAILTPQGDKYARDKIVFAQSRV